MDERERGSVLRFRHSVLVGGLTVVLVLSGSFWFGALVGIVSTHLLLILVVLGTLMALVAPWYMSDGMYPGPAVLSAALVIAIGTFLALHTLEVWSLFELLRSRGINAWLFVGAVVAGAFVTAVTFWFRDDLSIEEMLWLVLPALTLLVIGLVLYVGGTRLVDWAGIDIRLVSLRDHWQPVALVVSTLALLLRLRWLLDPYRTTEEDDDDLEWIGIRFREHEAEDASKQQESNWANRLVRLIRRTGLRFVDLLLVGGTAALFGATFLYYLPTLLVDIEGLTPEQVSQAYTNERRTILAVLAGLGAALTLVYTHLRHQLDRDANSTGRYSEAVRQLSSDHLSMNLGGVYALARVARDSPRDRDTICEVLAAYARESTWKRSESPEDTPLPRHTLPTLKVLSDLPRGANYPDLRGINLSYSSFRMGSLPRGAILDSADLRHSVLENVKLRDVDLTRAKLSFGHLKSVTAERCSFDGLDLEGCDVVESTFVDLSTDSAPIQASSAKFGSTQFQRLDFSEAGLKDASFNDSYFDSVQLDRADLRGVSVSGGEWKNMRIDGADMRGAVLQDVRFRDVSLYRCDLRECDLSGVKGLKEDNLERIMCDDSTRWPDGFEPPRHSFR
ncbi:pentapeptide repeat-containing protein [Nocardioides limicola]|uniref:pentapeptide repeat-containing protein n=1 Tax=Nocardioides limicola TaxID=2803368 RepID=UPI00193B7F6D|nr:pentapeptide repeat-containing protein [Nocardioides sp. DJM-14]